MGRDRAHGSSRTIPVPSADMIGPACAAHGVSECFQSLKQFSCYVSVVQSRAVHVVCTVLCMRTNCSPMVQKLGGMALIGKEEPRGGIKLRRAVKRRQLQH
jgi:hypothetical protein